MSYEDLDEKKRAWAMECALAVLSRREQINAAGEKGRGKSDEERDEIFAGLKKTREELSHYYSELTKMGLSETEIEQLIQLQQ